MIFERYSAVPMFGVPIGRGELADPGNDAAIGLMRRYSIDPQPVPRERTCITPNYFTSNKFLAYVQLMHPEGPVVVDLVPKELGFTTIKLNVLPGLGFATATTGITRIELPTDQPGFAMVGGSPRFPGQLCLHEVIVCRE